MSHLFNLRCMLTVDQLLIPLVLWTFFDDLLAWR